MKKLLTIILVLSLVLTISTVTVFAGGKAKGGGTYHLILKYEDAWLKDPLYVKESNKKNEGYIYSMAASSYDKYGKVVSVRYKSGIIKNNNQIKCSNESKSSAVCGYHVVKVADDYQGKYIVTWTGKDCG